MPIFKTDIYTSKIVGFKNLPVPRQNDTVGLAFGRALQTTFSHFPVRTLDQIDNHHAKIPTYLGTA